MCHFFRVRQNATLQICLTLYVMCFSGTFFLLLFNWHIMPDPVKCHGLQHTRLLCTSPSPRVCPSSCPLHRWCYPAISSSDTHFSFCLWSFTEIGTFPMNELFASEDQSIRASTSASVLPTSIQCLFPLT